MAGTIALSDIVPFERVTAGGRVGSKREGALVCNGEELRRDGGGGGDDGFKRTGLFE